MNYNLQRHEMFSVATMYVIIRSLYLYPQVVMVVILMVLAKPMNNDQEAIHEIVAREIKSIVIIFLYSRILTRNNYNTRILLFFSCRWIKCAQNMLFRRSREI